MGGIFDECTRKVAEAWWYYTVQLADGSIKHGMCPDDYPFSPWIMQRKVDLIGADCLDIDSPEGVLLILAHNGGAR
jgi:hypothetical protein